MRKPRRTVYVSPGKDVTLYVPADTPSVVIDYLNRLKDEGQFSQGVMDIIIHHVTGRAGSESHQAGHSSVFQETLTTPNVMPHDKSSVTPSVSEPYQLKMADIFRQAQKNTGKLADASPGSTRE